MTDQDERVLRDAELIDMGQLSEIALWIVGAMASGAVGNAAYDALKKGIGYFMKRKGGRETEALLERVYEELRTAHPDATNDETRARLLKLFADAGFDTDGDVLSGD